MRPAHLATAALLAWLSLSAGMCATDSAPPPPTTVLCPVQPIAYTLADEHALQVEFDALPAGSALKAWITDYISERAALRACAASH